MEPARAAEARLAWALVEAPLCPPDAARAAGGVGAPEWLLREGDRLVPPPDGQRGSPYTLASLSAYAHLSPRSRPPSARSAASASG